MLFNKRKSKYDLIIERLDKIDEFIQEQRKFNQLIIQRLDNLVKKNNLKE